MAMFTHDFIIPCWVIKTRTNKGSSAAFFFFSSRRRHTISLCDWSSDVCSSDLYQAVFHIEPAHARLRSLRWPCDDHAGPRWPGEHQGEAKWRNRFHRYRLCAAWRYRHGNVRHTGRADGRHVGRFRRERPTARGVHNDGGHRHPRSAQSRWIHRVDKYQRGDLGDQSHRHAQCEDAKRGHHVHERHRGGRGIHTERHDYLNRHAPPGPLDDPGGERHHQLSRVAGPSREVHVLEHEWRGRPYPTRELGVHRGCAHQLRLDQRGLSGCPRLSPGGTQRGPWGGWRRAHRPPDYPDLRRVYRSSSGEIVRSTSHGRRQDAARSPPYSASQGRVADGGPGARWRVWQQPHLLGEETTSWVWRRSGELLLILCPTDRR